jgi:hypothetical protein
VAWLFFSCKRVQKLFDRNRCEQTLAETIHAKKQKRAYRKLKAQISKAFNRKDRKDTQRTQRKALQE